MKKVAVLFGGRSSEYEVSLKSAAAVLKVLNLQKYEIIRIGITKEGEWYHFSGDNQLIEHDEWQKKAVCRKIQPVIGESWKGFWLVEEGQKLPVDILFPVMHGEYVEDGRLQGLFTWMDIPYVGCNTAVSALCMDKGLTHRFANSIGIETTPSIQCRIDEAGSKAVADFIEKNDFPMFIKPLRGGSSKGIRKITNWSELQQGIKEIEKMDTCFTLEKEVVGFEVGCGILGNQELVIGEIDEIELQTDFFDYTEKYQLLSSTIHLPARISADLKREICYQAERLYRLLGCSGLARIDFFITCQGAIFLNEINTMPGFTENSRYPNMLKKKGFSYSEIIEELLRLAEEEKGW
ncbi:D-alanine--D-alanine ligase family protein [Enterococcus sp. LJL128]